MNKLQQQVKCHHLAAAKSGQECEGKYGAGQKRWRGERGTKSGNAKKAETASVTETCSNRLLQSINKEIGTAW